MNVVSYSDARNSLKTVLDTVVDNADHTLITRRSGGDAVVMSLDSYNSLMETIHLLSTPANAAHLARAIEQDRAGQTLVRDLLDDA